MYIIPSLLNLINMWTLKMYLGQQQCPCGGYNVANPMWEGLILPCHLLATSSSGTSSSSRSNSSSNSKPWTKIKRGSGCWPILPKHGWGVYRLFSGATLNSIVSSLQQDWHLANELIISKLLSNYICVYIWCSHLLTFPIYWSTLLFIIIIYYNPWKIQQAYYNVHGMSFHSEIGILWAMMKTSTTCCVGGLMMHTHTTHYKVINWWAKLH